MTNMLMITTTMWMLDWIHSNTTHTRPRIALCFVLVVGITSLQERLVDTTTTSNDTDCAASCRRYRLLGARREADARLASIFVVRDNSDVVARSTGEFTTVTSLDLNIAHSCTFWYTSKRKRVTHGQLCLCSAKHRLSCVHAFSGNKGLCHFLVTVWMTEHNTCKWCTTTRIMNDLTYNTADESSALRVIDGAMFGCSFAMFGVCCENTSTTFSL
mmetsp:Transcript_5753/g.8868  ORF Transcript_5753/g.8868 Transcript_5753/m.8868 type:complete len:215 (-) Transcript_5753:63-707(-)